MKIEIIFYQGHNKPYALYVNDELQSLHVNKLQCLAQMRLIATTMIDIEIQNQRKNTE